MRLDISRTIDTCQPRQLFAWITGLKAIIATHYWYIKMSTSKNILLYTLVSSNKHKTNSANDSSDKDYKVV